MKPTRRTFLRVLGSVIIGAAVAPALQTSTPVTFDIIKRGLKHDFEPRWVGGAMDRLAVRSEARRRTLARDTGLVYDVELAA